MAIKQRKPSPAMVVAMVALAVALGGVAFAALPASNGTIHGCIANGNGSLRVVDAASDCRKNERTIAWNRQGPPGASAGGVVTRVRSAGPITVTEGEEREIPLTGDTWPQGANEFQQVVYEGDVVNNLCSGEVVLARADHEVRFDLIQTGPFGFKRAVAEYLYEPGQEKTHTITASVRVSSCADFENRPHEIVINSIKVDVIGFR